MSKQIGILSRIGVAAAAIAFIVSWSSGFVIPAYATTDVSPVTLLVWRFVPLAVILAAVVVSSARARAAMTPRALGMQAIIGLFAQFGYCLAVYGAVAAGIATGTVALIDAVQPLVVAVLVGPVLGLRVRGSQWAGLVIGAVGVLLVVRSQLGAAGPEPAAYALPALAMVCLVVGTLLQRRHAVETPVVVTLAVHVAVTAVLLLVIAVLTGDITPPASGSFWLAVVLTAVFPTLAAYGLYWWLLRRVGVTALQSLLFLIAPSTSVAGALLLDEPLTVETIIGFALCGIGVAVVLVVEASSRAVRPRRSRRAGDERGAREAESRSACTA